MAKRVSAPRRLRIAYVDHEAVLFGEDVERLLVLLVVAVRLHLRVGRYHTQEDVDPLEGQLLQVEAGRREGACDGVMRAEDTQQEDVITHSRDSCFRSRLGDGRGCVAG